MKKTFMSAIISGLVIFSACNNDTGEKAVSTGSGEATAETTEQTPSADDKELKVVNATYKDVDGKVAGPIKEMLQHYIHVKNALASDNANEAGAGAKALNEALAKVDPALLSSEQKATFKENADDIKEMAEHIAEKRGDIGHQREHFAMMSEDMYALAKAFGTGRNLYHQHCPMYNENKGAMWLSETKEIKNPYFGSKMLKCGEVKEVIK